jgi:transposase-like protein
MVTVKDLTEITLKDLWREVKGEEDWWGELKEDTQRLIKRLLESTMDEEIIAQLQVARYQRSGNRLGYRNGHRYRSLLTEFGLLDKIKVPRDRQGTYQPRLLKRYQRRQEQVNEMVREMFLDGVSTRKVKDVLKPMLQAELSAQSVSRIVRSLDSEVKHFHQRWLMDNYQYLFFDGITLKVKGAGGVKKRFVLCIYGITINGVRELVSFRQASSESEAQWEAFLRDIYERGLEGKQAKLITTDGCLGLHRALDTVYPYIPRQRCWAHKLRNVASKLKRKNQEECLRLAKKIYLAETRREATGLFREWVNQWRTPEPKAVKCLEVDMDEMLSFLDCPKSHWSKIRTTNAIERAFREVRRRTRPMSCFQNPPSVDRIIYGVTSHLNKAWKEKPLPQFTHFT